MGLLTQASAGPGLQHSDEFQRQAGCHGFRDLGLFHAKPELYSRKEGEVLQNPLSPELPRTVALPSNDAGGPEAEGGEPETCSPWA